MCGTCHEIKQQVDTKATSAHAQLACPDCHEPSRAWYRFPETLALRVVMLTRNLGPHLTYEFEGGASPLDDVAVDIAAATCLECHDPSREVTLQEDSILIDHATHAQENDSCISCHRYVTHPPPGSDPALVFMEQCFACHGLSASADAPGECDLCHGASFDPDPASHRTPSWQEDHGRTIDGDRGQCLMCHAEQDCEACHGIEMPHPEEWTDGATRHSNVSTADRAVCVRCHEQDPDFCTVCHHEDYSAASGTWVSQHTSVVEERGAAFCVECHEPTFCVGCHTADRRRADVDPRTG
jgi:nitrate/TMAO reductase-like tetraheme cytochrome c subunit